MRFCWVEVEEVIVSANPLYMESFTLSWRWNPNIVASYFNPIHECNIMPVTTSSLNTISVFNGRLFIILLRMFRSSQFFRLL